MGQHSSHSQMSRVIRVIIQQRKQYSVRQPEIGVLPNAISQVTFNSTKKINHHGLSTIHSGNKYVQREIPA
jgi:hypothetical protein